MCIIHFKNLSKYEIYIYTCTCTYTYVYIYAYKYIYTYIQKFSKYMSTVSIMAQLKI